MNAPKFKKLGQLYNVPPNGHHPKLLTHAANALPVLIDGDVYRIYYNSRDKNNRSSVGAVDIDIVTRKVVREHTSPFFEFGKAGSFFENGVSIGCIYEVDGQRYILFMGWQKPDERHWFGEIGRLRVMPDLSLVLDDAKPMLGLNDIDPISISYPAVIKTDDGYKMWYGSTETWEAGNGEMLHALSAASSADGINWNREGQAVPHVMGTAQAFSRPSIAKDTDGYRMWFSYRGARTKYRIGSATSCDGKTWELALDEAGIDVSASGWDSEMIEYPFVFDHKGKRYMLYNGNEYGKTGFGLAVQE